jgi:hypothetical protein
MIEEKHLTGLDNEPIKTNKKPTPKSINPNLPPCYFNMLSIGMKGSGKTYSLVKLIKLYEKYPFYDYEGHKLNLRVILFCPTAHSTANPIYETLKDLDEDDIVLDYSDDKLLSKLDDIEKEKEDIEHWKEYLKAWKKFESIDENINLLLPHELVILNKYDFTPPNEVKEKPLYKYPRINILIFDDLVSDSNAFKRGHSALNHLCIKHRHLQCNLIFTTQYIKAIPPVIRRNVDLFILFKFANSRSVLEQIYPEVSGIITEDKFIEIFEYSTRHKNDCLIIDNTPNSEFKFKKNWDIALTIKD